MYELLTGQLQANLTSLDEQKKPNYVDMSTIDPEILFTKLEIEKSSGGSDKAIENQDKAETTFEEKPQENPETDVGEEKVDEPEKAKETLEQPKTAAEIFDMLYGGEKKKESKPEVEEDPVTKEDFLELIRTEPKKVAPSEEAITLAKLLLHWFIVDGGAIMAATAVITLLIAIQKENEKPRGSENKALEAELEMPTECVVSPMPSPLLFPPIPASKPITFQYHGLISDILKNNEDKKQHPIAKFHLLLSKAVGLVRAHPLPDFSGEFKLFEVKPVELKFTKENNLFATQRTSLSNTRCSERLLKAYKTDQPDLQLSSEEVGVFASKPLSAFIESNIELANMRMEGLVEKLPIDLSSVSASKTQIAQNTLNRMQEDMSFAYNEAKNKHVPHLAYLNLAELTVLKEEVAKLAKRQLQPTEQSKSTGAEHAEGSKVMQSVMFHLRQLQDKLSKMQRTCVRKIQTELKQVNALANDISRSGTKEEQLFFNLQQLTGQRESFAFESTASILISEDPLTDLKKFNPFATAEQCEEVLNAITQVMLETVMIGQLNNCMASVLQLVNHLFNLLQIEVAVLIGGDVNQDISGFAGISKEMLQFAMEGANYVAAEAYKKLRDMKAFLLDASNEESLKSLTSEDRMKITFALYHHSNFDESVCHQLIKAELNPVALLNLADRGCYWDGKKLILPNTRSIDTGEQDTMNKLGIMVHVLEHTAQSLATHLCASRCYMHYKKEADAYVFDPRFLVFEFVTTFLLHKRQVEIVLDFKSARESDKSSVHQMIMGAGKTSVVCPMLVLMLADGKSLVTQVVLSSLLEMSRDVLRSVFSSIIYKRVYTLTFDRSNGVGESPTAMKTLFTRINRARMEGAVVCTTPEAVKSLMLKYVDLLQVVQASNPLLRVPNEYINGLEHTTTVELKALKTQIVNFEKTADIMRDLIRLWGPKYGGVALLDEVDVILHPLKSELNFPIGEKKPLALTPLRYLFAIHLLNAVLYHMFGASTLLATEEKLLQKISKVLQHGEEDCWIQRNPHTVLLSSEFYERELKVLFAEWSLIWLHKQKSIKDGLTKAEIANEAEQQNKLIGKKSEAVSPAEQEQLISYITHLLPDAATCAFVDKNFDIEAIQLLNLARLWVCSFLPHCISKIDRIMYGLLQAEDLKAFEAQTGQNSSSIPLSRQLLAVPFIGKDCPTPSSEFAHPEVLIGLSILAYRYEGLRKSDLKRLVMKLKDDLQHEPGNISERPTYLLFQDWIEAGQLAVAQKDLYHYSDQRLPTDLEVLPLNLFQPDDDQQMQILLLLLARQADTVVYYLVHFVFPDVLRHQPQKLLASGQDLGADMLFSVRLGFSGTPSDILPKQLGGCNYEPGTDAEMIRVLTSPDVIQCKLAENSEVDSLLELVANGGFNALIDTGALITGLSNEQVARKLLEKGLKGMEACVFLDHNNNKMIVDRSDGPAVPLHQSGISIQQRFSFYDQVHTTGMDIKQTVNAVAAVTLSKDMTLRDLKQGSWRMRGLGRGQTVQIIIVREVAKLIKETTKEDNITLLGICTWLLINTLQSEQLQYMTLCHQNIHHIWRKKAFDTILNSNACPIALQNLTDPKYPYSVTRFNRNGVTDPETVKALLTSVKVGAPLKPKIPEKTYEELSFEEKMRLAEEDPTRYEQLARAYLGYNDEPAAVVQQPKKAEEEEEEPEIQPFNQEKEEFLNKCIHLFKNPLEFLVPDTIPTSYDSTENLVQLLKFHENFLSDDEAKAKAKEVFDEVKAFYKTIHNPDNMKERRDWDAEMIQEQEQEQEEQKEKQKDDRVFDWQISSPTRWPIETLKQREIQDPPGFYALQRLKISSNAPALQFPRSLFVSPNFSSLLTLSNNQRRLKNIHVLLTWKPPSESAETTCTTQENLRLVALSLKEAETIRYLAFTGKLSLDLATLTTNEGKFLLDNRLVPKPEESNLVFNEWNVLLQCTRFFNGELTYTDPQLIAVLRALSAATPSERRLYFQEVVNCRRCFLVGWENASVSQIFNHNDDKQLIHINDITQQVVNKISEIATDYEGFVEIFKQIDRDGDNLVSDEELQGFFDSIELGLPYQDVRDIMRHANRSCNGYLNLREFVAQFGMGLVSKKQKRQLALSLTRSKRKQRQQKRLNQISHHVLQQQTDVAKSRPTTKALTHREFRGVLALGELCLTTGNSVTIGADKLISTDRAGSLPSIAPNWVSLTNGKWYYEVTIVSPGPARIGWATKDFVGDSDKGLGIGSDAHSWGIDGYSGKKYHDQKEETAIKWSVGDILCCAYDSNGSFYAALNGEWNEGDLESHLIFKDLPKGGVYPVVTFDCSFQFKLNLGEVAFSHALPSGFRSVCHWISNAREFIYAQTNRSVRILIL